ncbi:2-phospho-L-lactate guanylyltransferase [Dactylosporangium darangshiense]|uniref:Phosphoenolpyruvate guanylyltransferase n=1 Tax=Dactylosporangium darangshiense TaxID=579108 RepID=A0ABP8DTI5_9ACTN
MIGQVGPGPCAARPWVAVLPVKPFALSKSRLQPWPGADREELARTLFLDTLRALRTTDDVAAVVVVTDDPDATALAVARGVLAIPDHPRAGLNAAILRGAAHAQTIAPGAPVVALTSDLAALRGSELSEVLAAARDHHRAFLADHTGRGTTLLTAQCPAQLQPAFEGSSRQRHMLSGAWEITDVDAHSVRLDVDTEEDLRIARRLGLGPHTSRLLAAAATGRPR